VHNDQSNSTVIIATNNARTINELSLVLSERDYTPIIEDSSIRSLLKILDQEVSFVLVDVDSLGQSSLDLMCAIKKTRPRIPIITLSHDMSIETIRQYAQLGIFYCAINPVQPEEINQVLDAIERYIQRSRQKVFDFKGS
jgi:DNA-binding NtrC family response regulator